MPVCQRTPERGIPPSAPTIKHPLCEFRFSPRLTCISAVAPDDPFGGRLGVQHSDVQTVFVTPGPIYLPLSGDDLANTVVAQARALSAGGIASADIVDQTVNYQWVIGGTLLHRALEHIGCLVVPGGPGQTDLHARSIAASSRVTAIVAFPSFLEHLLERARDLGISLELRLAAIAGEMSDGGFQQRIEREHGIIVRDRYGVAEVGPIAYECGVGVGLHLDESVYVEFVDPDTAELRGLAIES